VLLKLTNAFNVPVGPDECWVALMDVPRVIPCLPGARLTEVVGDNEWNAAIDVKLGPMGFEFGARIERTRADETAREIELSVTARELRGKGEARAVVESSLAPGSEGTTVSIDTDLTLQGAVARYGGGLVADVAAQLTKQFAECLARHLERSSVPDSPSPASTPAAPNGETKPIGGLGLLVRSVLARIRRVFARG
jgi:carbon monoxide dehydrogenase subunit G